MILVTGPTGTVGSALLPQLVRSGAQVRALAHSEASRRQIEEQGAEAVDGDFDDPGSLEQAMEGCDHLFLLSPPDPRQAQRELQAIDVARRVGVDHVVAVSVMGADPSADGGFTRWHGEIDAHLTESGLGFTILKPAGFMQAHLLPVGTVLGEGVWYGMTGDGVAGFVDARDVAAVAAHVLTGSGHTGATYEITGPEPISMPQAAAQLSQIVDRPIRYVDVPADEYRTRQLQAGLPDWRADSRIALYRKIREGHAATVTNEVERATGRPARSYREFAEDHRDAFVGG